MTQKDKISKALDNVGVFNDREKNLITKQARLINIPENWAPIAQSTLPDKVYLIVEGEAVVRKNKQDIATLTAGDLMGEMGVVNKRPRNATVVAKTDLTVLHFTPADWRKIQTEVPSFAKSVENIIAERA